MAVGKVSAVGVARTNYIRFREGVPGHRAMLRPFRFRLPRWERHGRARVRGVLERQFCAMPGLLQGIDRSVPYALLAGAGGSGGKGDSQISFSLWCCTIVCRSLFSITSVRKFAMHVLKHSFSLLLNKIFFNVEEQLSHFEFDRSNTIFDISAHRYRRITCTARWRFSRRVWKSWYRHDLSADIYENTLQQLWSLPNLKPPLQFRVASCRWSASVLCFADCCIAFDAFAVSPWTA